MGHARWAVGHKGQASAVEIEVVQLDANATNSLIRAVVDGEFVGASLPAKFNIRVNNIPVKFRVGVYVEANAAAEHQRSNELLREPNSQRAEIHDPVKAEWADALTQGAATGDRELGVVEKVFL